jgi:DEAD/DEAH box helicase domain-containing protein
MNARPSSPTVFETLERVGRRSAAAFVGQIGLRSQALRTHLLTTLAAEGGPAGFLTEPVIEAAHPWATAPETFGDLAGSLLSTDLVRALDGGAEPDPDGRERYRLPAGRHPFTHQLAAWKHLLQEPPTSVLVSSGTGSGKTECFLVPILEHLAREAKARTGPLTGVRAIMLYPLNALINSQRERLSDWTRPFRGELRFCLYNGATRREVDAIEQRRFPEEVLSRKTLRQSPPPILVTNITMLEYMLVRREDQPILHQSKGRLKYIVLDEAHSYIGSQAAELSLLLRRVMRAFGVSPEDVRVVATSATIGKAGDAETQAALRRFLADVAGLPPNRVTVIEGKRSVPQLPEQRPGLSLPSEDECRNLDPAALFDRLGSTPAFRAGFDALSTGPMTLGSWSNRVGVEPRQGARLLEAASRAHRNADPLQPLKVHAFHRTQGGVWACVNPACPGLQGTALAGGDWPFGPIVHERLDSCPHCQGPVFEAVACSQCGETSLDALISTDAMGDERLVPTSPPPAEDEFLAELADEAPDEDGADVAPQLAAGAVDEALIISPAHASGRTVSVDPKSGAVLDGDDPNALRVRLTRGRGECPCCRVIFGGAGARLANLRVGGPFMLGNVVPELLEDVEPVRNRGGGPLPADGRQVLTFTDSRQGTARLAAKLQRDAERAYIRAMVYHAVQRRPVPSPDQQSRATELERQIASCDHALSNNPDLAAVLAPARQNYIDQLKALIPDETIVPFRSLLDEISKDPICHRWMKDAVWKEREKAFQRDDAFSRFALLREVVRRPRVQNSIETMGLARIAYSAIEKGVVLVPEAFSRHGGTLDDWRDFLNLAINRVFRENFAVAADRESILHWIAPKIPPKFIVSPRHDGPIDTKTQKPWPTVWSDSARRPITVSLLAAGLGLNLDDPAHRDDARLCMEKAWDAIQPLLVHPTGGAQLDPDRMELAPIRAGFLCPVTRRILDRTFRGLSPYPLLPGDRFAKAEPITMPVLSYPFRRRGGDAVPVSKIETWLTSDPDVEALRAKGLWSDLHDRLARFDVYFRSAEHSAQQSGAVLREYESAFRRGEINVLNCSTTMEMGVDIGSIGTVVMTNVPPSPASYRQRVGRAGRRGQPLALSLTICKNRPLEQSVFRRPLSILTRPMAAPSVKLDSLVIAQRHANALLLARFLQEIRAELTKLETGPFLGFPAHGERSAVGSSPAEGFIAWIDATTTRGSVELQDDLKVLLRGTPLELSLEQALDSARDTISAIRNAFELEWTALREDLLALGDTSTGAGKALAIAMRRLTGEYLLSELPARGFLPAHGFPTDVVSFDTSNMWIDKRADDDDAMRRFAYREAPTRQLDLAIRDYAPGSEVVLDGVVFRSAGVRLDWKRPASADAVPEIQSLRNAWRCERCGSTDTSHAPPDVCPVCSQGGASLKVYRYLKPSGFTCDPVAKPHAEIERIAYVAPKLPWVTARGEPWVSFGDERAGRFRASRRGMVFHHTTGATELGYAICLCCGRAEPETAPASENPPVPSAMQGHSPLRGSRKTQPRCDGSERAFGIQRHRILGHEISTDVVELQLTGMPDVTVGLPIAAALRDALASHLGIEPSEMGFGVTHTRDGEGQAPRWSVFLYDRAPGGAGFAISAPARFPGLLQAAAGILDCPNGDACKHGCTDCVLTRETEGQQMDRQGALAFLRDVVLPRLVLPSDEQIFGRYTRAELEFLPNALAREMEVPGRQLTVWLGGDPRTWDFQRWSLIPVMRRMTLRERIVDIVMPRSALAAASEEVKLALFGLHSSTNVRLRLRDASPLSNDAHLLARVGTETEGVWWGTRSAAASQPGPGWASGAPILCGDVLRPLDPTASVEPADLVRQPPGASLVEIGPELDGNADGFGARFWRQLLQVAPALGSRSTERLLSLHYSDRYLLSPLTVRLVASLLRAAPGRDQNTKIGIDTASAAEDRLRSPETIQHDWIVGSHAREILQAIMASISPSAQVHVRDRRDLAHSRSLLLTFAGGTVRVILDQGVGFWQSDRRTVFDFGRPPARQAEVLMTMPLNVRATPGHRTWIAIAPHRPS